MKSKIKAHTLNILNGMAIGIIVALVPGAILNAILNYSHLAKPTA